MCASFNNTIVTITDSQGNVMATAGAAGFKGLAKHALCRANGIRKAVLSKNLV